jgi:hypothetical protein
MIDRLLFSSWLAAIRKLARPIQALGAFGAISVSQKDL